jgi:hypothetical protein
MTSIHRQHENNINGKKGLWGQNDKSIQATAIPIVSDSVHRSVINARFNSSDCVDAADWPTEPSPTTPSLAIAVSANDDDDDDDDDEEDEDAGRVG